MSRTPYETIEFILAEIRRRADDLDWVGAAEAFNQLSAKIQSGGIPEAKPEDAGAIERAKAHLDAIAERATPLHKDLATLLKAFGGADKPAPADNTP